MTEEEVQSIVNNESFVGLMMAAQDDTELKNSLLYALRSDDLTRTDIIQRWVHSGITKGAPRKFNQAIAYLAHREIANEAIKLLAR